MAGLLIRIAEDTATPHAVRVAAIKDVLDRAGVNSKQEIEVTLKPWEQVLVDGIINEVDDDQLARASHVISGDEYRDLLMLDAEDVTPPQAAPDPPPPPPVPTPQVQPPIPSRRRRSSGLRRA